MATANREDQVSGTSTTLRTIGSVGQRLATSPVNPSRMREQERFEKRSNGRNPSDLWRKCCRGKRYSDCTLEEFDTWYGVLMRDAVRQLTQFGASVGDHVAHGRNLILYGPSGTGKDHLMAALLRLACNAGIGCTWTTGPGMAMAFRSAFDGDGSETGTLKQHTLPAVLAISDPILSGAKLTAYQEHMLYQAIDDRYSECRSTWITCNAADRAEMERHIGVAVVDRLRHNALVVHCNWPSYRKAGIQ